MVVFKDFELILLVDGDPAPEYIDDDIEGEDTDKISRYVQVTPGAHFSLTLKIKQSCHLEHQQYLKWKVMIDGQYARAQRIRKSAFSKRGCAESRIDCMKTGSGSNWVIQEFKFAELLMHDAEPASQLTTRALSKLGTIAVDIERKKLLPEMGKVVISSAAPLPVINSLSEKELKGRALSMSAGLGLARKDEAPTPRTPGELVEQKPIARFELMYRSKEALQHLHILPRTPSPPPLEERPIETLSMGEMRELIRRQREDRKVDVKREVAHENIHIPKRVKIEGENGLEIISSRSVRTATNSKDTEVIDLSD